MVIMIVPNTINSASCRPSWQKRNEKNAQITHKKRNAPQDIQNKTVTGRIL
jgi:hypothetical protein